VQILHFKDDVEVITAAPFAPMDDKGAFPWVFSTYDVDRQGERIDPAGWDIARYLENPVIEWAHCYSIPAIGRAEGVCVDDKGLHGSIVFNAKDYDAFGWSIGERVKAGVIRAASVGFRAIEVELPSDDSSVDLIFRKQELMEISVCNVPANPWALAKSLTQRQEGTKEEGALRGWQFLGNQF
jgi:HK97 family phage prohead protease